MIQNEFFNKLTQNHPFITICSYANQDYVGIVQNRDDIVTTIYDYGAIIDNIAKEKFLELGDIWWWESNRMIPMGIFLRKELIKFRECLMMMNTKDVNVKIGPVTSLNNLAMKRSKRKSVQLVRKPK